MQSRRCPWPERWEFSQLESQVNAARQSPLGPFVNGLIFKFLHSSNLVDSAPSALQLQRFTLRTFMGNF